MIGKLLKENMMLIFLLVVVLLISIKVPPLRANDLNLTIDSNTDEGTFNSFQDGQDNDIDFDIVSIKQFKGGQSNPTYLIEDKTKNYVLRRKPPGKLLKSAHAVDREYKVITALGKTDVPVPETYCFCEDENVIGTQFFLMDHVDGNIYWELLLPDSDNNQRREIYLSMNDTIAKLHNVDFQKIGLGDYGKHENYMARQIHRWTKQYKDSETQKINEMDNLIEWLPINIPEDNETTIVHGDFRLDNMIFDKQNNKVMAILDWELSTLGNPIADFTYHMMSWRLPAAAKGLGMMGSNLEELNIPSEHEYAEMYYKKTGRSKIENWDFYMAYNIFRLAGIAQGIVGRVRDGTASSSEAKNYESFVPILGKLGWNIVEEAAK